MLQIKNICKKYVVSVSFRDNEFVAILGPSGSGKTTMLNIIGGLDRYDSGDLVINGVSTKEYKDRDWDTYRNHSIGFVFQSYNLIGHQSVLANVELALTISGVSRSERRERAKKALEQVGLGDQIHKKPNQMSGGQMQRIAIARALVNNPEILLADEPTGALDTQTGIQVMELLKEVAKDKLVVMVTHNPELAEEYATRIVKVKDGHIIDDSNPLKDEELTTTKEPPKRKASMSFLTSLGLSANNLRTKKGRTALTSFAGSIGIIGIALILALSSGVNNYISDIQKSTMTSYPITISSSTLDVASVNSMHDDLEEEAMNNMKKEKQEYTEVYSNSSQLIIQQSMVSNVVENNLTAFKKYIDDPDSEINQYIGENGVVYTYDIQFDVYVKDENGDYLNTSRELEDEEETSILSIMASNMSTIAASSISSASSGGTVDISSYISLFTGTSTSTGAENFAQMSPGTNDELISAVILDSYDVIYGAWPTAYNEVVLVIDSDNCIATDVLCQLGFISTEEYEETIALIEDGASSVDEYSFDYSEIVGTTFKLVTYSDYYEENDDGTFTYIADTKKKLTNLLDNTTELTVVGIVRANDNAATTISAAVGYTYALTEYIIDHTDSSAVVIAQESDDTIDVLSGRAFETPDDETKIKQAKEYISELGESDKSSMYIMAMYYEQMNAEEEEEEETTEEAVETTTEETATYSEEQIEAMLAMGYTMEDLMAMQSGDTTTVATTEVTMDDSMMASLMDMWLEDSPDNEFLLSVYDEYLLTGTYDANMSAFGKVSYDAPSSIIIYCDSFSDKESISDCIDAYNATAGEDNQISYTDYVALMTTAITSMVDIISYVLIAFVSVSLIVSCIMISIITQISVMERTKEIGILRAIGASKANISQVFNAETFIIGAFSGTIGVVVSWLLTYPINSIIHTLTDSEDVNAVLDIRYAIILVLISLIITVISGIIPSRNAAKKDPVTALRSE